MGESKLYEIPEGSRIETEISDGSTYLTFEHLDGMYRYCTTEKCGVVHLSVHTPLIKKENGHYEIKQEEDERRETDETYKEDRPR